MLQYRRKKPIKANSVKAGDAKLMGLRPFPTEKVEAVMTARLPKL
jgi:hypothetical protein